MKRIVEHIVFILAGLCALFVVPIMYCRENIMAFFSQNPQDAVSSASYVVPDQPSGEFFIFVNKQRHPDTLEEWTDFFCDRPVGVIFEDIRCITIDQDVSGRQLAERYQARLAQNQMQNESQDGLLAVSKAQWGWYDVMIVSKEFADYYSFSTVCDNEENCMITVKDQKQ